MKRHLQAILTAVIVILATAFIANAQVASGAPYTSACGNYMKPPTLPASPAASASAEGLA